MTTKPVKAALVQHSHKGSQQENLAHVSTAIAQAAASGADLVVLQELFAHAYFCQTEDPAQFDLADTLNPGKPGPTLQSLSELARQHGVVLVASLFEKRAPGLYHNTAVVFEKDGSIAGRYRKMHIPDDPGFYEKFYFTEGDLGFRPVHTSVGALGVLVCWDQWFPEAARLMTLAGADMLIYPTAIGWDPTEDEQENSRQLDAWLTVQRGHAIANGIPVLACNRWGFEPSPDGHTSGTRFWGNSFIVGPQGEWLARASTDQDEIVTAMIDKQRTEHVRRIWPFLRDRRIDAYDGLLRRFLDE